MRLFEIAMHHLRAALAEHRRLRLRRRRAVEAGEPPRHVLDDPLVVDRACRGHHHVRAAVMRGEIAAQRIAVEGLQGLGRSQQRAPHRLVRIAKLIEMLEHHVIGRILRRADFLHNHALFALELVRHEGWIGEDVGQHVERQRHVGLHHARIISGGLGRGAGVEIAADRLDLLDDLARGARGGTLERHVLEQMRDAVLVGFLVAAADAGPNPERRGLKVRHGVGDYREAGGKLGDVDAHPATPCFAVTDSTNRSTSAWSLFMTFMCSDLVIRPSSHAGSCGRTPQAASTASGNFAACAVDSTMFGMLESQLSRSVTASATAVWGSTRMPASRQAARIAALVSVSSARPASNSLRIAARMRSGSTKRPDCASEAIRPRSSDASRPDASNSRRSKFDDTWISIDGDAVAWT